jgi:hypothetical protein
MNELKKWSPQRQKLAAKCPEQALANKTKVGADRGVMDQAEK